MAFNKQENEPSILDSVLLEHKKISEAPNTFPDGIDYDIRKPLRDEDKAWIGAEQRRRYKALGTGGEVYLIMNPLVWPRFLKDGQVFYHRPKPKLIYTKSQARDAASETIAIEASELDQDRNYLEAM